MGFGPVPLSVSAPLGSGRDQGVAAAAASCSGLSSRGDVHPLTVVLLWLRLHRFEERPLVAHDT